MLGTDRPFAVPALAVYLALLFLRPLPLLHAMAAARRRAASSVAEASSPSAVEEGSLSQGAGVGLPGLGHQAKTNPAFAEPSATLVMAATRPVQREPSRRRARSRVW